MTEYNDEELISKTQIKREQDELQQFGEQLMGLKQPDLERLPMTAELLQALDEGKRITSHEARRRHSQFIGKLLRNSDSELICEALEKLHDPVRQQRNQHWLERLLDSESNKQVNQLIQELLDWYPHGDRQHLRNLTRNLLNARVSGERVTGEAEAPTKEKFRNERKKFQKYLNELDKSLPLY